MISVLFGVLGELVGWLITHLPVSPFSQLSWSGFDGFGQYSLQQCLAWANWIFPAGEMLALFDVWIVAIVAASAAMWVVRKGASLGTNGVLGGEGN